MKVTLHQTHITIADFEQIFTELKDRLDEKSVSGVHAFPELFLTGYPLQDLCLNKSFLTSYRSLLQRINDWSIKQKVREDQIIFIGGLKYNLASNGSICTIENVIYQLQLGSPLKAVYSKVLLPNYDIFDEKKYFSPGRESVILDFMGKKIGLLVCEDMWPSSAHKVNPVEALKSRGENIDIVVNLSASPFNLFKTQKRLERAKEISEFLGCAFAYVNRVGGEDEIIFDGESFVLSNNEVIMAKKFKSDTISLDVGDEVFNANNILTESVKSTWEGLFDPALEHNDKKQLRLKSFNDSMSESSLSALKFGLQEYARKSGFNKFLVALSGGIDSALVLTIAKLSLTPGQTIEAVYMPSQYSRDISEKLSVDLCKNLDIPLKVFPISNLHESVSSEFETSFSSPLDGLADENIQSRLRGAIIYARSNQTGAMVINTSNKSELAVGYSTLYGDSVGAISLLGDLYKSEVFSLSQYINKKHKNIIPTEIITRPPSAELRDNQEDAQSLPEYDILDAILEGLLSYRMTLEDLVDAGFNELEVKKVIGLYKNSEYKRVQFCPIIKLKSKSFGFGYRVPLSKNSEFYY